ncbi:hypothetical protein M5Z58_10825, partial [Neisseria meningitidis]|nr:hypothetical protein [Neisseria meningitidis]
SWYKHYNHSVISYLDVLKKINSLLRAWCEVFQYGLVTKLVLFLKEKGSEEHVEVGIMSN